MVKELFYEVFKFIGELNYWHVALLSALESTAFPVVVPVETVIIPMGYYAYLGTKSLSLLIFSCTIGIVIGCVINYAFARFLGRTFIYKHAKLLHINVEKLQKLEAKFLEHGRLLMFVGRFIPIPAFKHIITLPAGMAKMPLQQFIFYNALGGCVFSTSMLLVGYFFGGSEELVHKALGDFGIICVILFGAYIVARFIIKYIIKRKEETAENERNEGNSLKKVLSKYKITTKKGSFSTGRGKYKKHFLQKRFFKKSGIKKKPNMHFSKISTDRMYENKKQNKAKYSKYFNAFMLKKNKWNKKK